MPATALTATSSCVTGRCAPGPCRTGMGLWSWRGEALQRGWGSWPGCPPRSPRCGAFRQAVGLAGRDRGERTRHPAEDGPPAHGREDGVNEVHPEVSPGHLSRDAYLYVRQSTVRQVSENTESTRRQYALRERGVARLARRPCGGDRHRSRRVGRGPGPRRVPAPGRRRRDGPCRHRARTRGVAARAQLD